MSRTPIQGTSHRNGGYDRDRNHGPLCRLVAGRVPAGPGPVKDLTRDAAVVLVVLLLVVAILGLTGKLQEANLAVVLVAVVGLFSGAGSGLLLAPKKDPPPPT